MVKLIWTDQAINDLQNIGDYIAEDSEQYARLTVKTLFERTGILKQFPNAGRIVPEKNMETSVNLLRDAIESSMKLHPANGFTF